MLILSSTHVPEPTQPKSCYEVFHTSLQLQMEGCEVPASLDTWLISSIKDKEQQDGQGEQTGKVVEDCLEQSVSGSHLALVDPNAGWSRAFS